MVKPRVVIIGTGGTIAGMASTSNVTVGYSDAQLHIADILRSVPGIEDVAAVKLENFCQLGSEYIDSATLWKLAKLIKSTFAMEDVTGIVVTHGSDTIEESALFLDLVYDGMRPIVLVPAMRPSSALSADGPFNLLQAVAIAADPSSHGRGVVLTWSNRIGSAAFTTKASSRAVDAFEAHDRGLLGTMLDSTPIFYAPPIRLPHQGIFAHVIDTQPSSWPKIHILLGHQEMDPALLSAVAACGAQGVVIACTGDGTLPQAWSLKEKELNSCGIPVVRASRVLSTYVAPKEGCLTSGLFSPQKARIVLQLALLSVLGSPSLQLQEVLDPLAKMAKSS